MSKIICKTDVDLLVYQNESGSDRNDLIKMSQVLCFSLTESLRTKTDQCRSQNRYRTVSLETDQLHV